MSFAGLDLGEGAVANLLCRNNVNCDLGIILFAPFGSQHVHKPLVKLGKQMGPFRDLERPLAGESSDREMEKRAKGGRARRKIQEITPRAVAGCVPDHLGHPGLSRRTLSSNSIRKSPPAEPSVGGGTAKILAPVETYSTECSKQNLPVVCRQAKLFDTNGSSKLLCVATSRNASEAMAPLRGSGMAGQMSQTAPLSVPSTASWPSAPQPLASSSSLSSWAVRMTGVPSRFLPFFAAMFANTLPQVVVEGSVSGFTVYQK